MMVLANRISKKLIRRVTLAVLVAVIAAPVFGARAVEIQDVRSQGGITAWLVEDHSVPVVSMSFAFRGGGALDPKGKKGLAEMVSALLDEGAGDLDSQAYQRRLEDLAASIHFRAHTDTFRGGLRTLSENRDQAFELLRLALTAPRFDSEPVERIRAQLIAARTDAAENPREIVRRTWWRAAFPEHPYGLPTSGTAESLAAIRTAELKNFVARRMARDNLVIGVVGDIGAAELARRLDAVFGPLPQKAEPASVPEARAGAAGRIIVIEKPIPQSVVLFGQNGLKRDDADYYAAYVMNHVLGGGGFSSRLTEEVRDKRGLAYSVYSYLNPLERAGVIMGWVATQNARVAESLRLIRAEWRKMAEKGVGAEELTNAKTYINGSFPLRMNSSRRIAGMLVAIQLEDLGIDYIDRRASLIDAVTAADIRRVAKRILDPDGLAVVVVGQPIGIESTN